jgi:hypothetical protein
LSRRSYCEDGRLGKKTIYGWTLLTFDELVPEIKSPWSYLGPGARWR